MLRGDLCSFPGRAMSPPALEVLTEARCLLWGLPEEETPITACARRAISGFDSIRRVQRPFIEPLPSRLAGTGAYKRGLLPSGSKALIL